MTFFAIGIISAQKDNNSDYYLLYKGGDKISKPIIYILLNDTDKIDKNEKGEFTLSKMKNAFNHIPGIHNYTEFNQEELRGIKFVTVDKLFIIEDQEYKKRALGIKKNMDLNLFLL